MIPVVSHKNTAETKVQSMMHTHAQTVYQLKLQPRNNRGAQELSCQLGAASFFHRFIMKYNLYKSFVISILLYECETWTLFTDMIRGDWGGCS